MKKLISVVVLGAALTLAGCSTAAESPANTNAGSEGAAAPEAKVVDLAGEWKQVDGNSDTNYQTATITEDTISIDWVNEEAASTSVYWVGTYTAPTDPGDSWAWPSVRDAAATDSALLASTDDSKEFNYENGAISYDVTMMGTTMTVKLEKQ